MPESTPSSKKPEIVKLHGANGDVVIAEADLLLEAGRTRRLPDYLRFRGRLYRFYEWEYYGQGVRTKARYDYAYPVACQKPECRCLSDLRGGHVHCGVDVHFWGINPIDVVVSLPGVEPGTSRLAGERPIHLGNRDIRPRPSRFGRGHFSFYHNILGGAGFGLEPRSNSFTRTGLGDAVASAPWRTRNYTESGLPFLGRSLLRLAERSGARWFSHCSRELPSLLFSTALPLISVFTSRC